MNIPFLMDKNKKKFVHGKKSRRLLYMTIVNEQNI